LADSQRPVSRRAVIDRDGRSLSMFTRRRTDSVGQKFSLPTGAFG
jgi:hypothetical protein